VAGLLKKLLTWPDFFAICKTRHWAPISPPSRAQHAQFPNNAQALKVKTNIDRTIVLRIRQLARPYQFWLGSIFTIKGNAARAITGAGWPDS